MVLAPVLLGGCSSAHVDDSPAANEAATGAEGGGAADAAAAGRGGEGAADTAAAGRGGEGATGAGADSRSFATIDAELSAAVEDYSSDVPFTLLLGDASGTFFVGSNGDSSESTAYASASTSKWVTAAVILDLVERDELDLDTRPQDLIPWWTTDEADPRSQITLRHLLSFTSGLQAAEGR
jgi:hypothetical protein